MAAMRSRSERRGAGCVAPSRSASSVGMKLWPCWKVGRLALPPQVPQGVYTSSQLRSSTIRPAGRAAAGAWVPGGAAARSPAPAAWQRAAPP
jgi:hypothetical protein